ncbi:hypothetical protein ACGFJC_17830 [Nonomuraea fuscirosea]|jgi:uncharacterized MnhB-related membrane protein|uniref:Uncharacterized protein n=1 Tax=Nonomuraea fuscirosea TaxID=1291556 RepID=A0A2T0N6P1_9ACTN|nr:hypothetical protein [Nonomuraea fuscirosea]PRX68246.1 hypothetical protein B0I32_103207 [Nonomuraea fuscirosea]WSA50410.1 hypothetical protein OIE67_41100 [Nonomuraea fuscirosea]
MGLNLRLVVPLVYAAAVVVAFLIGQTVGSVVAIVGAILVAAFFVITARSRQRQ